MSGSANSNPSNTKRRRIGPGPYNMVSNGLVPSVEEAPIAGPLRRTNSETVVPGFGRTVHNLRQEGLWPAAYTQPVPGTRVATGRFIRKTRRGGIRYKKKTRRTRRTRCARHH
jgi:hypothetical protein